MKKAGKASASPAFYLVYLYCIYFNAANTLAVIVSTEPVPSILRYAGAGTLAAGSPFFDQLE